MLFLAQPRTASHAVAKALISEYGFFPSNEHHATLTEARRFYPISERTIVFSTVRNHFDWFISFLHSARMTPIDLKKLTDFYLDNKKWFSPPDCVFGLYLPDSTHVIRYENLLGDCNEILRLKKLGPISELPRVNFVERERLPYRKVLDQLCINWIVRQFGREMRDLGYWPNLMET